MSPPHPARTALRELIAARNRPGADTAAIDARIWKLFGERRAVLVSDMTGFTLRTEKFGITHFLALIQTMREIASPVLLEHDGLLIKTEADNLFALFRDTASALRCATRIHEASAEYNRDRPADEQIRFCIGIGWGDILVVGDADAFGSEVNRAFKLGEDTARAGETLLTPDARAALETELPDVVFTEAASPFAGLMSRYFIHRA